MIIENRCGSVVPPGDATAFADAIETLADDSAERAAMGRRGRELAEREFGREALACRFAEFLEDRGKGRGSR